MVMHISTHALVNNTFRLPCTAQTLYDISQEDDLAALLSLLGDTPYRVISAGSNVLCALPHVGAVVRLGIKGIDLLRTDEDAHIVRVGAGEVWHDTVLHTIAQGWFGLENLALIPGWVGAAPVQNIGAYGVELCDVLHNVRAWDTNTLKFVDLSAQQCEFGYRDSVFKRSRNRYLITNVTFRLPRPWRPTVHYGELAQRFAGATPHETPSALAIAQTVMAIRQRKLPDPALIPNAGSFFKNPVVSGAEAKRLLAQFPSMPCYPYADGINKLAAGWLIEQAGWKGYIRDLNPGKVGVHSAQALVLVHLGGAQGTDLLKLASDIQTDVLQKFGIVLEREVNVWE